MRSRFFDVVAGVGGTIAVFFGMIILTVVLSGLLAQVADQHWIVLAMQVLMTLLAGLGLGVVRRQGWLLASAITGVLMAGLLLFLRTTFSGDQPFNPLVFGPVGAVSSFAAALVGAGLTARSAPVRLQPMYVTTALLGALVLGWGVAVLARGWPKIIAWHSLQWVGPPLAALGIVLLMVQRRQHSRLGLALGFGASVALLWPFLWQFGLLTVTYPARLDRTAPALTVRLPADAPLTVAWGGDSVRTNYHANSPDQRWAYDLTVAPHFSGSTSLEAYGCFGIPVVAPIPGTVVAAHDGEPDQVPGRLSANVIAPLGNHVTLRVPATGTYLVLAHMQQGSVAVAAGQQVEEGEVLGHCGNSGNTSEPHIQIHHQRQSLNERPLGWAEGLPLFFRDHDGPAMPEGGFTRENGRIVLRGPTLQDSR